MLKKALGILTSVFARRESIELKLAKKEVEAWEKTLAEIREVREAARKHKDLEDRIRQAYEVDVDLTKAEGTRQESDMADMKERDDDSQARKDQRAKLDKILKDFKRGHESQGR